MVHRLGRMLIGETSVAVMVTAEHRGAGLRRLRWKPSTASRKLVPIWKKEHFVDGEVWVEGEWDENIPFAG